MSESLIFKSRKYQVTGTQQVLGHEPGEVFHADIPPVQEAQLLLGGHLRYIPEFGPVLPRLDDPPADGAGGDDPPTPTQEQ